MRTRNGIDNTLTLRENYLSLFRCGSVSYSAICETRKALPTTDIVCVGGASFFVVRS